MDTHPILDTLKKSMALTTYGKDILTHYPTAVELNAFLIPFLRYKDNNVKSATKLIQQYWQFRTEKLGLYTRLTPREVQIPLHTKFIAMPDARDLEGRPIIVIFFNRMIEGKISDLETLRSIWFVLENIVQFEESQKKGVCLIVCLEGGSKTNRDRTRIELLFDSVQNKIPVKLGSVFILNPPQWCKFFWSVSSNFLKAKLVKRIKVLSGDYQEQLWQNIGKQNLLRELGGDFLFDHDGWLNELYEEKPSIEPVPSVSCQ
ncbi:hypothetical protein K7432_002592 [Basidiobolus ranarum]|uniref:CRAL-TRIO domain-containing protein n=1 Tax=Basidiobolus ranarum TaxID=34480 RepID=A0ABR2X1C5_9FUNG